MAPSGGESMAVSFREGIYMKKKGRSYSSILASSTLLFSSFMRDSLPANHSEAAHCKIVCSSSVAFSFCTGVLVVSSAPCCPFVYAHVGRVAP
jgi:hypothetical protein